MGTALARSIALAAHAGQVEESTGDPYWLHLERVACLVQDDDAKAVAWLHDVIEDTSTTADDLLKLGLSPRIVTAIAAVTRTDGEDYAAYIQRLKDSGNALAIEVKLADLKDHFRPNCPPRLLPRYRKAWKTLTGAEWPE